MSKSKSKLKEVFAVKPERMSKTVKKVFALPLAFVMYLVISLIIPRGTVLSSLLEYSVLLVCVLLVSKYFVNVELSKMISDCGFFRFNLFLKGFTVMLFSGLATSFIWMLIERESFFYSFDSSRFIIPWIVNSLTMCVGCFCEEYIFRSYIVHFFNDNIVDNNKKAVLYCLVSAVLFSLAHFSNPEVNGSQAVWAMLFYLIMGFALMAMTIRTKGIEKAFGVHLANNLISVIFFGYENSVIVSNTLFTHSDAIGFKLIIQAVITLSACMIV